MRPVNLILMLWCLAHPAFGVVPGDLDASFGMGGIVLSNIGSGVSFARSVVVQSDDKLIVAGYCSNGIDMDFFLVRYLADGGLDSSFGTNGIVVTPVGSGNDYGLGAALQSDGKILVAGTSFNGSDDDFAIVRFHSHGGIDASFGNGGKVIVSLAVDGSTRLAVLPDGKILVSGTVSYGSSSAFALLRLNSDGGLDTSFGVGGSVTATIGATGNTSRALALQPDGKILVAGDYANGSNNDFAVVRFNANGTLDTTFGSGGKAVSPAGTSTDYAYSVALQSTGHILVAGYAYVGSTSDFAMVRFTAAGSVDSSFGVAGRILTPIGTGDDYGLVIRVQPDDRIVFAGSTRTGTYTDTAVLRFQANGSLDTDFGLGGKRTTTVSLLSDVVWEMAIQSDGKLVVVGSANNNVGAVYSVLRYWGFSPMDSWRLKHFGNSNDGGNASDGADPDFDGNTNFVEFALGSDPRAANSGIGQFQVSNGNAYYSYTRFKDAMIAGISCLVEWSDTLEANSWTTTGVSEIVTDGVTKQDVTAIIPTGVSQHRFARLKLLQP